MTDKKTIHEALFAVQQEAPSIGKSADNPFFKSKYADLPAIWDAIKPILGKNGLYVTNQIDPREGGEYIVTKVVHAPTGESVESVTKILLTKSTAQEYGSYITYMRRYALSALLGLVTDEDDDGNKATQAAKKQEAVTIPEEVTALNKIFDEWQTVISDTDNADDAVAEGRLAWQALKGAGAKKPMLDEIQKLAQGKAATFK